MFTYKNLFQCAYLTTVCPFLHLSVTVVISEVPNTLSSPMLGKEIQANIAGAAS